jgi:threonine/homoserine/homoserine lactone efflux protein
VAIAYFIVAPFIAVGALWLIRMGVKIWRSPGGESPLELTVMGWDRAVLMMGIALAWMAVVALGLAFLDVTKSPIARWVFGAGSIGMVVFSYLFASVWLFNQPRFLVPPALRGLPGTFRGPGRNRGGEHTRR